MHEFTFCKNIVDAVLAEFEKYADSYTKVLAVSVVIGKMHQVLEDNLRMAYTILTKDTAAENSTLILRFTDIEYKCLHCGKTGIVIPPLFLCAECGSGEIDLVGGRELYLENMEL